MTDKRVSSRPRLTDMSQTEIAWHASRSQNMTFDLAMERATEQAKQAERERADFFNSMQDQEPKFAAAE